MNLDTPHTANKPPEKITAQGLVRIFVPVLVFLLMVDIEIPVAGIQGQGERVGYSDVMSSEDILVRSDSQEITLKLGDIFSLLIFIAMLVIVAHNSPSLRIGRFDWSQFLVLCFFVLFAFLGLMWNRGLYTGAQLTVCLLYLAKFAQTSLIFLFVCFYFRFQGDLTSLFKAISAAGVILAVVGAINPHSGFFFHWLIDDRVQFYGLLVLVCLMWLSFSLTRTASILVPFLKPKYLYIMIFVGTMAILSCEKRTVILGLVAGIGYLFIAHINRKNSLKIVTGLVLVGILGAPFLLAQIDRSLESDATYLGDGLSTEHEYRIRESWLSKVSIPGLDKSITDRLARWLISYDYFLEKPLFGVGYWGAPYSIGMIPDSVYFQVLVETGAIGFALLFVFIARIWLKAKQTHKDSLPGAINIGLRASVVAILVMGITANTIYISNLFGLLLVFAAISRHASRLNWGRGDSRSNRVVNS